MGMSKGIGGSAEQSWWRRNGMFHKEGTMCKSSGKDRSHGHRGLEGRPQFWASDEVKVAQVIQIPGGCAKSLDFMLKAARSQDKFKQ